MHAIVVQFPGKGMHHNFVHTFKNQKHHSQLYFCSFLKVFTELWYKSVELHHNLVRNFTNETKQHLRKMFLILKV